MGVYSTGMFVPDFPQMLPKLCVVITVVTPFDKQFKSLKIRILKNDTALVEQTIDPNLLVEKKAPDLQGIPLEKKNQIGVFSMPVVLSPFPIDQPMILRVRVIADGEELRGPGLLIRKAG